MLLVYEHWLVRPDDLSRVNRAFFHVNAVVSLGLLAVGVIEVCDRVCSQMNSNNWSRHTPCAVTADGTRRCRLQR